MKNTVYISIIAILLITSLFYWQRSRGLSHRLALIQERIEETREELAKKKVSYQAKAAIVIDDMGYNVNNVNTIWQLGAPVTLSILPNLPYSRKIAETAGKRGLEVILHLPMEPYENVNLEEGTIMTDMEDEDIRASLEKAISSVPRLKGVSNHMGSKATEDERLISIIFERMKEDDLYFLDSLVTNKSLCRRLSQRAGLRFASRSVFLDNESDAEYIKGQIEELADHALATGCAVGIGHDRALTLAAIKEMLPLLESMRIEIVPVSEIAE